MTTRTTTLWRNTAGAVAICLAGAVFFAALWFRATYHFFPGMVPTTVHWCASLAQSKPAKWVNSWNGSEDKGSDMR